LSSICNCPSNQYWSGSSCSAKKAVGESCSTNAECVGACLNSVCSSLIHHWPMDSIASEKIEDIVGGKHATDLVSVSLVPDRNGNINSAIYFNYGYASLPAGFYVSSGTGYTLSYWVYFLSGTNNYEVIFSLGIGSYEYRTCFNGANGKLYVKYGTTSSSLRSVEGRTLAYQTWIHVAVTVDTLSKTSIIYVNGILDVTYSNNLIYYNLGSTFDNNFFGKSLSNYLLNGFLDDFKIFSKVFTQEEILQLYKAL